MQTPLNTTQLSEFLQQHLNLAVASRPLIDGHQAPLDYLAHVFFQGRCGFGPHGLAHPPDTLDSVVWASRGGGKTFLGAVATALDLVFKPGIEIHILGGSLDQSRRMHAHLRRLFAIEPLADLVDGRIGESRLALKNGSVVELLAQSHTAVRGTRVQTLRCDEAELFKQDVFDAAMLTTISRTVNIPGVGPTEIAGSIECLSTLHVPFGLMSRLVCDSSRRVFKWGVVDVLADCGPRHVCSDCSLRSECVGKAKPTPGAPARHGHLTVSDAVRMKQRVSLPVWRTEMLCLEPSRADTVFPEFDPSRHVFRDWTGEASFRLEPADMPGAAPPEAASSDLWVCGIDFGFRAPTVLLWGAVDAHTRLLRILDERIVSRATTSEHVESVIKGNGNGWRTPDWIGIDPAGKSVQSQTGLSDAEQFRQAGFEVRAKSAGIDAGLRLIRARLAPADGPVRLLLHARCRGLIEALTRYHYRPDDPQDSRPVKDGSDHAVDALRYLVLNLDAGRASRAKRYI